MRQFGDGHDHDWADITTYGDGFGKERLQQRELCTWCGAARLTDPSGRVRYVPAGGDQGDAGQITASPIDAGQITSEPLDPFTFAQSLPSVFLFPAPTWRERIARATWRLLDRLSETFGGQP